MATSTQLPAVRMHASHGRIAAGILDFVADIPSSRVAGSAHPTVVARRLAQQASRRAALTAGTLALPPGPAGWLTMLPELLAVWRIQAQMVSDIAAAYGKHAALGREQMLYCLFRHTAAQAFRDVVVRAGDRLIFRRATLKGLEYVAQRVGIRVSQRALGKGLARWLPVAGAVGVGWYARHDTRQVAQTAIDLFTADIILDPAP